MIRLQHYQHPTSLLPGQPCGGWRPSVGRSPMEVTDDLREAAELWLSACSTSSEGWEYPYRSESPWGDIVFEWWCGEKKLTVYFGRNEIEYVRVWGDDIQEEMDEGPVADRSTFGGLWRWLREAEP